MGSAASAGRLWCDEMETMIFVIDMHGNNTHCCAGHCAPHMSLAFPTRCQEYSRKQHPLWSFVGAPHHAQSTACCLNDSFPRDSSSAFSHLFPFFIEATNFSPSLLSVSLTSSTHLLDSARPNPLIPSTRYFSVFCLLDQSCHCRLKCQSVTVSLDASEMDFAHGATSTRRRTRARLVVRRRQKAAGPLPLCS